MNHSISKNGRHAPPDGMSGLQIMPFPFANPWNWGALTPLRGLEASVVTMLGCIEASRFVADAARAAWRAQQDMLLEMIQTSIEKSRDGELGPEEAAAARFVSAPTLGAMEAFSLWNDALLRAEGVTADREVAD